MPLDTPDYGDGGARAGDIAREADVEDRPDVVSIARLKDGDFAVPIPDIRRRQEDGPNCGCCAGRNENRRGRVRGDGRRASCGGARERVTIIVEHRKRDPKRLLADVYS